MSKIGKLVLVKGEGAPSESAAEGWLAEGPIRLSLIHHVISVQGPHRKRRNASTKTRSDVSGGGRKPWKQKGTGRARQGSTRSPQWRHGGVVFGPHPRIVSTRVNRRESQEALADVLRVRSREGRLGILEEGAVSQAKASVGLKILTSTGWTGTVLLVAKHDESGVRKAFANSPRVRMAPTGDFRADLVMKTSAVLMTRGAWNELGKRLGDAA